MQTLFGERQLGTFQVQALFGEALLNVAWLTGGTRGPPVAYFGIGDSGSLGTQAQGPRLGLTTCIFGDL